MARMLRAFVVTALLLGALPASAEGPIRVLLLGGLNTHEGQHAQEEGASSRLIAGILEETGRFAVDVIVDPNTLSAETLAPYRVVVDNWSSYPEPECSWNPEAQGALVAWVRAGGGFVPIHAVVANFPLWRDFREMLGVTWDEGTANHAAIHTFGVQMADDRHPVTRGLGAFEITDELYQNLTLGSKARPLALAYSAPESGGTGREEPVAVANDFGRGRCFAMILGHDARAMDSDGWRLLLARGTEWSATGRVTVTEPLSAAYATGQLASWRAGDPRATVALLERVIRQDVGSEAGRARLATALRGLLAGDATDDAKRIALAWLPLVAEAQDVAPLAELLADPVLAHGALEVLADVTDPSATRALLAAAERLTGTPLAGVLNALGTRRDARALGLLERALGNDDANVSAAAARALGRVGGARALRALVAHLTAGAGAEDLVGAAALEAAGPLETTAMQRTARDAYSLLWEPRWHSAVRAGALAGLLRLGADDALLRDALHDADTQLAGVAAAALAAPSRADARLAALEDLGACTEAIRPRVVQALGESGDRAMIAGLVPLLHTEARPLRTAARTALRRLGAELPELAPFQLVDPGPNLALGAVTSSPDGLEKDGAANGDAGANDGNLETYWDEADGQSEYILELTFPAPVEVGALRITAWQQHNYAARDFDVLCDGRVVCEVHEAEYTDNSFSLKLPPTSCTRLTLRITGCYGASPAIREIQVFGPAAR